ncbi:MAG: hypothetical protein GX595_02120 [Lentisphaerae bacterium]|nr:hypothetical protein [Lentisphaerota bacterium]
MTSETPRLLAVCLNPAWQKTLSFDRLTLGAVNRAASLRECGGGKGVNAARAMRIAGASVTVASIAGGATGALLEAELSAAGIASIAAEQPGSTRVCTTLVDGASGVVTELIEPSPAVPAGVVEALRERVLAAVPRHAGVALCGSAPPGVPESFYADVARAARAAGAVVLLDGVSGVAATLESGVDLVKINAGELRALSGLDDLAAAAAQCRRRWRIGWLGVTAGAAAAWLFGPGAARRWRLPRLEGLRNTTGAGDCASGIWLQRLAGRALDDAGVAAAFVDALAAASASCLTDLPSAFDPARAAGLRAAIRPEDPAAS